MVCQTTGEHNLKAGVRCLVVQAARKIRFAQFPYKSKCAGELYQGVRRAGMKSLGANQPPGQLGEIHRMLEHL
jgi:hypothetical protein